MNKEYKEYIRDSVKEIPEDQLSAYMGIVTVIRAILFAVGIGLLLIVLNFPSLLVILPSAILVIAAAELDNVCAHIKEAARDRLYDEG